VRDRSTPSTTYAGRVDSASAKSSPGLACTRDPLPPTGSVIALWVDSPNKFGIIRLMDASTDPPPVRHTPRGQVIRERIVDAAVRLVFERGVARTNVDDVRDLAGVSGSQMSHYFHDKKSLVRAVIDKQADSVIAIHQLPELGNLDSFETLYRWAALFVERLRQQDCRGGCALGALAGELGQTDAEIRSDLADGFDRWSSLLRDGLAAMRDRGDLSSEADPDELALGLLSALQGGALLAQVRRDVEPVRASLNAMLARVRSFATDRAIRTSSVRLPVSTG
jgi:TetR/AcrR family transcriptional regulator, transcriptional repressor for nem operon